MSITLDVFTCLCAYTPTATMIPQRCLNTSKMTSYLENNCKKCIIIDDIFRFLIYI